MISDKTDMGDQNSDEVSSWNSGTGRGLTLRSFLVAVLFIVLISLAVQQVSLVLDGPELIDTAPPAGPITVLVLLTVLTMFLSRFRTWFGFSRKELVVIYCMVYMGSFLSGTGLVHRFFPGLVTLNHHYSEPEVWVSLFIKYIPSWFGPEGGTSSVVEAFFNGSKEGVPWGQWLLPLALWSLLIFALFLTMLCIVSLLRRQWVETENLSFPITQLPLEIIDAEGRLGQIGGLLRNRLLWFGFAISAFFIGYNGLSNYVSAFSPINLSVDLGEFILEKPWSAMTNQFSPFVFSFSPLIVGISYLFPLEVSFSVWFFFMVGRLQMLLAEIFGLSSITSANSISGWVGGGDRFFPLLDSQARGGLYALILFSLWTARFHIKEVLFKVFNGEKANYIDDSKEAFSYRFSLWGIVGGLAVSIIWTNIAGLNILYGFIFFTLFLLLALAFARIRSEAGVPFAYTLPGVTLMIYVILGTGSHLFSASDYLVLAHINMFCASGFAMLMVIAFESYKMGHVVSVSPRCMTLALLLSFVIGLVVAYWMSLTTIYKYGMSGVDGSYARGVAYSGRHIHHILTNSRTQLPVGWLSIIFQGIGFAVTSFLAVMRRTFSNWLFHPIGFVIGNISISNRLWGSVLLGWAVKSLMLKYGGVRLYRMALPLFLGLAFGHLAMQILWAVVALLAGTGG